MAFEQKYFSPVGANSTEAPALFSYKSNTDTLAVIATAGYFSDKQFQLTIGDMINVTASDESGTLVYKGETQPSVNTAATTLRWHYFAERIGPDLNFLAPYANGIGLTLDAMHQAIFLKLMVDGRDPKIVTTGVTINGNSESLILEGDAGAEYVLFNDGTGSNYILKAISDAPFSFEGLVSGVISGASRNIAGSFDGATAGAQTATQTSTSGAGTSAVFDVTIEEVAGTDALTVSNSGTSTVNGTYSLIAQEFFLYEDFFGIGWKVDVGAGNRVYLNDTNDNYALVYNTVEGGWTVVHDSDPNWWLGLSQDDTLTAAAGVTMTVTGNDTLDGDRIPPAASSNITYATTGQIAETVTVNAGGTGHVAGDLITVAVSNSGTVNTQAVIEVTATA